MSGLSDSEYQGLYIAVRDGFVAAEFGILLKVELNKRPDFYFSDKETWPTAVNQALIKVEEENWIYKLIAVLKTKYFNRPPIKDFFDKFPNLPPPPDPTRPGDPFEVCFLRKGVTFVNRNALRQAVKSLWKDNDQRVIIVDGNKGSGKTYSSEYLYYSLQANKTEGTNWRPARVSLTSYPVTERTPDAVVRAIALQLDIDLASIPQRNDAGGRWPIELCNWLLGKINAKGIKAWIILDEVRQVDLPIETRDLVGNLIKTVAAEMDTIRLVVLACNREYVPSTSPGRVFEEMIYPIGRLELQTFFENWYREQDQQVDIENIKDVVNRTVKKLPENQDEWPPLLSTAITQVLDELSR